MRPYVDMSKATSAFNAGVNYMSRLTGIDKRKITLAEAASVLKACAAETKVAKLDKVEQGAILRAFRGSGLTRGGQFTVNAGVKKGAPFGRVFMVKRGGPGAGYRRTHDAAFQTLRQHYRDPDWLALQQTVALAKEKETRAMMRAPDSVALARGSWVLLADSLGVRIEEVPGGRIGAGAIAAARASKARRGLQARNAASVINSEPSRFFVTLINRYPGGQALGFQRKLAAAISGRALYMARALEKGFDASAAQTARLFPGWVAKPSTSS